MDLYSKKEINYLLKKYSLRPSKGLGQNFLIDKNALKKIIRASQINKKDIVLEIGPGLGALTKEIAKKAKKVIAIEKDPKIVNILEEALKDFKNVEIIQADILKNFNQLSIYNYKVVANLPYYITSPIIRMFLESKHKPKEMVLTMQKEVGQRIVSQPPCMSLLSVSVQFYAKPSIIAYIAKKSFWPKPKVDSAVLHITDIKDNKKIDKEIFFKIVKAGFSQPRKQLLNNLSKELKLDKEKTKLWLLKNNIQPFQRAETLSVNDWIKLVLTI